MVKPQKTEFDEADEIRMNVSEQVMSMLGNQEDAPRALEVGMLGITVARAVHGGVTLKLTPGVEPFRLDTVAEVAQLVGLLEGSMRFIGAFAEGGSEVTRWEVEGA